MCQPVSDAVGSSEEPLETSWYMDVGMETETVWLIKRTGTGASPVELKSASRRGWIRMVSCFSEFGLQIINFVFAPYSAVGIFQWPTFFWVSRRTILTKAWGRQKPPEAGEGDTVSSLNNYFPAVQPERTSHSYTVEYVELPSFREYSKGLLPTHSDRLRFQHEHAQHEIVS